jgi:flavin reductase (DIM6/NTAB) family NADH-FMN oxidoreductase RutF
LGKRSGKDYNKEQYLFKKDVLMPWKGFHVLKQSTASMLMHIRERIVAGDHDVLICQVQAHRVAPEFDVLTLNKLRSKKLIRI